jgi:HEAT repeat protein
VPGRLAWILLLIAGASTVQAADEPKPRALTDQQVRGLVMALDDPLVQFEALKWCAEVRAGHEELFEPINKLCQHDDSRIRNAAASAIAVFGERAVDVLTQLLNQTVTRRDAAYALGQIGEKAESAVGPLTRLLTDKDADINTRRAVATALGRIGEKAESAVQPLTKVLTDKDTPADIRRAVAIALGQIGKKAGSAFEPLIKVLTGKGANEFTREAAATAVVQIAEKPESAVEPLTKVLTDKSTDRATRRAAATALGQIGEKAGSAVEPLTKVLTDKSTDRATRQAAATALGQIGEKAGSAVETLIKVLTDKDTDYFTLEAAAIALGQIGEKAVEPLTKLLMDKDAYIPTRRAAATALGRIGEKAGLKVSALLTIFGAPRFTPENRRSATLLLRRNLGMRPSDLCELLEIAYERYDQRSDRILDAYLVARDEERPLIRWLGGRGDTDLPPSSLLQREEKAELIRRFTAILSQTTNTTNIRMEMARRMHLLCEKTDDLDTLRKARDELENEGMSAEATAVGNRVKSLEWWRKAIDYLKATSSIWAGHALFWVVLVAVYPYSRWVQAFFFWNPWVRRIAGFIYVPWVITLVPPLRRRLLRPFQANLIPDRFQHEFRGDSYFAQSRITATREGHTVTQSANEYLKPPLRGPRVIEAPSGYGKTTLLQWFVQQPGNPRVVLRATECDHGVMKSIQQCVQGIAKDEGFLRTLVYSGGLDVIIDGLNEASPETRGQIGTFVNDYFRGNYLLTTQPLLRYKIPRAAELWKLQPLAADQVQGFLIGQWPRVHATAVAHGVSQARYEAAVHKLVNDTYPEADPDRFGLATPLDAALVADLIAQNVEPDLNNLIVQHVSLARDSFREIAPAQEPAFERVGESALELVRGQKPKLDLAGLEGECDALVKRKLLINHGTEYFFRHDRIRDYFIALSVLAVEKALQLREDPRFTGVFEFLPETLDKTDADELGEILEKEAADTADNRVWSKYKVRWDQPVRFERIERLIRAATTRYQARKPGETPNFVAIGQRTTNAIQSSSSPSWNGLEAEVDGLVAARVMQQGPTPNEPARFRTEDLGSYFVALYLASPCLLDRAKELSTDDRFAGLFEFLPRLLRKPERDELGKYLESASKEAREAGKPPYPAWEQYRKNWRRRKSADS